MPFSTETRTITAKPLAESYGNRGYVIQNPPSQPLTQMEMDDVYDLPYTGRYHPMYQKEGGIPALKENQIQSRPATEDALEAVISVR